MARRALVLQRQRIDRERGSCIEQRVTQRSKPLDAFAFALLALSTTASGKSPADYQVTGEVKEVTADIIVVMKGTERFEIARPADLKTDVKVGDKVTIRSTMTAKSIEKKAK